MKFLNVLAVLLIGIAVPIHHVYVTNSSFESFFASLSNLSFSGHTISELSPDIDCFIKAENINDHSECLDKLQRTVILGIEVFDHIRSEMKCFIAANETDEFIKCAGDIESRKIADYVCASLVIKRLDSCDIDYECIVDIALDTMRECSRIPHFELSESFLSIFQGVLYLLDKEDKHTTFISTILNIMSQNFNDIIKRELPLENHESPSR